MKTIIINEGNLTLEDIHENSTKVRALIINKNKIIIANYNGIYLLPGGSIDNNEDLNITLKREVKEETGITLKNDDIVPFILVEHFNHNYPKQGTDVYINKLVRTYYFIINTNQNINKDKIKLTAREIKFNFKVEYTDITYLHDLISNNNTTNPRNEFFKKELLTVLDEYSKMSGVNSINVKI